MTQSQPLKDFDADGLEDPIDNCPLIPNGPIEGTCIDDLSGEAVIGSSCTPVAGCGAGETCSNAQEDFDGDGVGDACTPCDPDPRTQGFYHRQCLGADRLGRLGCLSHPYVSASWLRRPEVGA